MYDVAVIGSANLDLVAGAKRHPQPGETVLGHSFHEFPGGKGLNQAVAAARSGVAVAFVGAVGDDDAGRRLVEVARRDGIDVAAVRTAADEPTGRALITVADDGENSIVVVPGANATVDGTELPTASVIVAQLEVPIDAVERAFRTARDRGARTVLNPAPARDLPPALLQMCDVIVPNEHEVELLGGVDALLESDVGAVIVTRGAAGASVHQRGHDRFDAVAPPVDVVDTTGAGDAFCGNLAARLAAGDELVVACRWAVAAGSLAVTVAGAVPSLPHHDDVAELVGTAP